MATANLDISEKLDIICKRGDSFNMSITMTDSNGSPLSVTGWTFNMEVKSKRIDGGRTVGITPPVTYEEIILSDDDITSDPSSGNGVIIFSVGAAKMKTLTPGVYVYDIQYYNPSNDETRTILEGLFKINPDVTLTA